MTDETTTATADQPGSGTTEAGAPASAETSEAYRPSFADIDDEPAADETPETQSAEDTEAVEQLGNEAGTETEGEQTEPASQDDFLASLDPAEVAYYAKRYPTLYKAYQDPNQPADLRQAFVDRVNQDHAYAELRDGQGEDSGEPTADQTSTQQVAQTPDEQRQAYYAQVDQIVDTAIDPRAVSEMGTNLLEAMGVDLKSEDPEIQAIVKNASKVGRVLARGAIDLNATTLANLLPSRLEMALPGISEMYYDALRSRSWENLRQRTVKGVDGAVTRPYAKLPALGSPQWNQAIDKALREMPELRDLYSNLPPHERFERQYAVAAKLMAGQKVDPALLARAVDTGRKIAQKAQNTRAAGKALGAGHTKSQITRPTGNEDIFGPGVEEYRRRGGG